MNLVEIFIIAIGLAMDCFAVSLSSSICMPCLKRSDILRIALFFGLFQGGMPVIGWLLGNAFYDSVSSIDHWIAFGILAIIGLKMIIEAAKDSNEKESFNIKAMKVLLWLSVATSIDAFVIGMGFAFLQVNIVVAVLVIGGITFLLSLLGVYLGKKFGNLIQSKWAEIAGGVILVGIGVKTLVQHLYF